MSARTLNILLNQAAVAVSMALDIENRAERNAVLEKAAKALLEAESRIIDMNATLETLRKAIR